MFLHRRTQPKRREKARVASQNVRVGKNSNTHLNVDTNTDNNWEKLKYNVGFGNHFSSEAQPGTLPKRGNNPQKVGPLLCFFFGPNHVRNQVNCCSIFTCSVPLGFMLSSFRGQLLQNQGLKTDEVGCQWHAITSPLF